MTQELGNSAELGPKGQSVAMRRMTFKELANHHRTNLKRCAAALKVAIDMHKQFPFEADDKKADAGEMTANLMLAYRHIEDASSRLGKAIQASDGGISVYDRSTTVGA